ncbi:cellulose synthase-like protein E1 isoform X2 [Herrania umbratica]|uniref:Cellulose synthase-like protein E1 isoform X2 n=1 Tax=Herrania umbratica TaxID=108875 RepID=A0A6J1AMD3_9ROSI|nr:cellulose synthase-like protein E1 isoform X2 [Herrania umbratica]
MRNSKYAPLFETKRAKGIAIYRLFAVSIFIGICSIWAYRLSHIPRKGEDGKWIWIGLFASELWFGFSWILSEAHRWNPSYRYGNDLPDVDIFVCTADPAIEPPMMVINTVLSVMAYDYPPEKLSVYLSDDAGSDITFYALLEASQFAKHWIPYCKDFNVEPRSPAAYFISVSDTHDTKQDKPLATIKKLYEDMENRIESAAKLGRLSKEICSKHRGFSQWNLYASRRDHHTILQILIDGNATDIKGSALPTLVYLAREKRPQHPHNFKAGAVNALIRVSSNISNGQIILNVDCDMYSNNSHAVLDALCFFLDEEKGHEIAFVQFPQIFENITKNDIYGNSLIVGREVIIYTACTSRVLSFNLFFLSMNYSSVSENNEVVLKVEFHGLDGYGGPLYIGTGCFHRRDALCGKKFSEECKIQWKGGNNTMRREESAHELEETSRFLASCTYEENTQRGKEIGLKYGCPVEDVITGLSIQCQGWKSVYFNPPRSAFIGVAPTTLPQTLEQHKRWSEGDFQIFLSKYGPAWFAHGKISLGLQMGYCCYCLWAPNCLPTLYYSVVPSLCLLRGISLFPQCSTPWFIPYVYVIVSKYAYSLIEFLWSGGTILGWWNNQRMWLYRRTSSYVLGFTDTILKSLGFSDTAFVITAKVADEDVLERYQREIMEFGPSSSSPMFTLLATIALLNLFSLLGVVQKLALNKDSISQYQAMALQILLCSLLVLINLPLYQGLFLRKDKGKIPSSVAVKSVVLALSAITCFTFMY